MRTRNIKAEIEALKKYLKDRPKDKVWESLNNPKKRNEEGKNNTK